MSSWRWAGACATGTSHTERDIECQDRAACIIVGEVVLAVVSDGAGSASHATRGAWICCTEFLRHAKKYLAGRASPIDLDEEIVLGWLDEVRTRIDASAAAASLRRRDFAATLVAVLIHPAGAVVAHVGDGAAVVRDRASGEWSVASWPSHGMFVGMTDFITDDPQPKLELVHVKRPIDRFAVFSDGIENLVLDFTNRAVPQDRFEDLFRSVVSATTIGRDRRLSVGLRKYLESQLICNLTDDDKSLILGCATRCS